MSRIKILKYQQTKKEFKTLVRCSTKLRVSEANLIKEKLFNKQRILEPEIQKIVFRGALPIWIGKLYLEFRNVWHFKNKTGEVQPQANLL